VTKLIRGKITGDQCEAIVLMAHWLYALSGIHKLVSWWGHSKFRSGII